MWLSSSAYGKIICFCLLFTPMITCAQEEDLDVDPVVKRETLAEHQVLTVYDSTTFHTCMGLTGSCPTKCGSSGEYANFSVKKYLFYKKHGEYGVGKQPTFTFRLSDYYKKPVKLPMVLQSFSELKEGDHVLISWRHDKITRRSGSGGGDRVILKFEKIDASKAKELLERE